MKVSMKYSVPRLAAATGNRIGMLVPKVKAIKVVFKMAEYL